MKLSIVDQVPVHQGKTQAAALNDAVQLAQIADELGYHRYWIAEHHATPSYASSCPELVISRIAAATKQIRVGSGGVMLSHYSPYRVAELFRTLSAFFPGRIDLGFGRAPGGSELSSRALAFPNYPSGVENFPDQVEQLIGFLHGDLHEDDYFADLKTTPEGAQPPQMWALGSGAGSINLAAEQGLGFVLALFIGTEHRPAEFVQQYYQQFRPRNGSALHKPQAIIANAVICAETAEEAHYLTASHAYWKTLAFRHGIREGLRSPKDCLDRVKQLAPSDQAYFAETCDSMVTGTPQQCREQLEQQAAFYGVDEVMVVAVTWSFAKRCESYRLLAQAFND
ncbi:LLM class flavin-dependent oxidoreductase [Pontibacter sp. JAM-7]|uniref:LLM class flavin-dependent oxidoreductase n=1 Tax=Pontibacter sp. JAM-7 TaxID=3366581 RepID=UPI003AF92CFB